MCRFILNYYEISFFTFLDLYSLPFPFIHNHLSFYLIVFSLIQVIASFFELLNLGCPLAPPAPGVLQGGAVCSLLLLAEATCQLCPGNHNLSGFHISRIRTSLAISGNGPLFVFVQSSASRPLEPSWLVTVPWPAEEQRHLHRLGRRDEGWGWGPVLGLLLSVGAGGGRG